MEYNGFIQVCSFLENLIKDPVGNAGRFPLNLFLWNSLKSLKIVTLPNIADWKAGVLTSGLVKFHDSHLLIMK